LPASVVFEQNDDIRNGRKIFYLALDEAMTAVALNGEDTLVPSVPQLLFQTGIPVSPTHDYYAITADGQRFLILVPTGEQTEAINIILNWTEALDN
jgi:hypothetical protein